MTWASERPTVPGWYWYKHAESAYIGCVEVVHGSLAEDLYFTWPNDTAPVAESGDNVVFARTYPPPETPTVPSVAEAMALAVLAGDLTAAAGLADLLTEMMGEDAR